MKARSSVRKESTFVREAEMRVAMNLAMRNGVRMTRAIAIVEPKAEINLCILIAPVSAS